MGAKVSPGLRAGHVAILGFCEHSPPTVAFPPVRTSWPRPAPVDHPGPLVLRDYRRRSETISDPAGAAEVKLLDASPMVLNTFAHLESRGRDGWECSTARSRS